mgnify:CR=1 FL=1
MQNTIYIAEPIFSERLQRFDSDASFPPIKKIGITTDLPQRRERELLGTLSPVKVAIVRAWTGVDARKVESMLHTILDNSRLDGEYFWDGNETLVDAVSRFIATYHPEAVPIQIGDDQDVKEAAAAVSRGLEQRIYTEVVPQLDQLGIAHKVTKNERGVWIALGDYRLHLGGRAGDRFTLTIWSPSRSTDQALRDFPGAQEIAAHGSEDSSRRARIPMTRLEAILDSLIAYRASLESERGPGPSARAADRSQSMS